MRFPLTKISSAATLLAFFSALVLTAAVPLLAQTETVLYSFGSQSRDGAYPLAGLIMDAKGNLYGTTLYGGAYSGGTVFELTPAGAETVLYSLWRRSRDGHRPYAGLVMDEEGNLYGTTVDGGARSGGTVFKVTPAGKETVLYSFCSRSGCSDGYQPYAGLIQDTEGNLYGTTYQGGTHNYGTVFKLTPAGTETVLYSFCSRSGCRDGYYPYDSLVMDNEGNLYGTTSDGGANGAGGTVFKLTPAGTETVLYSFGSHGDGSRPYAGLIMDTEGNLYGTTIFGGADDSGTVFELTAAGAETVLYSFTDGFDPTGLVIDKNGNLYGATSYGGTGSYGVVFELSPPGKGGSTWTFTSLHAFPSSTGDGLEPFGTLIMDELGNLYGTTYYGGVNCAESGGCGTVFKVTP